MERVRGGVTQKRDHRERSHREKRPQYKEHVHKKKMGIVAKKNRLQPMGSWQVKQVVIVKKVAMVVAKKSRPWAVAQRWLVAKKSQPEGRW